MASTVAAWPQVAIDRLLRKNEDWIDIDPNQEYVQITVRLWGKGVVQRGKVAGAVIAATRQCRVHHNQFILSRIDARNGAFGLVPSELEGAVVSNDFPTFNLDEIQILPAFLEWMSKTHAFVELCQRASEGTTNRVRLKEDRFLALTIPLPPLDEQRRIVAYIEALAARIEKARGLRREAVEEAIVLLNATANFLFPRSGGQWDWIPLEQVCSTIIDYRGRTPPISNEGIPHITSSNIKDGRINWTTSKFVTEETYRQYMTRGIPQVGDVIFTMEAPLGEAAVIRDNRLFSLAQRTLLMRGAIQLVSGSFLARIVTVPVVRERIFAKATGTTVKGIASKRLKKIAIPIPQLSEQQHIVAYLDDLQARVDTLKQLQAETQTELAALLPSVLDKAFRGEL